MSVLKELFGDRIGAASVVTHDVGDYEVAVGSPARVINTSWIILKGFLFRLHCRKRI